MTGRVVQEVLHHLVAVPAAAAAAAGGHRLRSRRPVRGGGGRGQVGHGAGEAQLREGRPEVRGGLEENACLIKHVRKSQSIPTFSAQNAELGGPILPLFPLELDRGACFADSAEIDCLPSQSMHSAAAGESRFSPRFLSFPSLHSVHSPLKE